MKNTKNLDSTIVFQRAKQEINNKKGHRRQQRSHNQYAGLLTRMKILIICQICFFLHCFDLFWLFAIFVFLHCFDLFWLFAIFVFFALFWFVLIICQICFFALFSNVVQELFETEPLTSEQSSQLGKNQHEIDRQWTNHQVMIIMPWVMTHGIEIKMRIFSFSETLGVFERRSRWRTRGWTGERILIVMIYMTFVWKLLNRILYFPMLSSSFKTCTHRIAMYLFPAIFFVFNLLYWTYYLIVVNIFDLSLFWTRHKRIL